MNEVFTALRTNTWLFLGVAIAALLFAPESWREYWVGLLPPTYEQLGVVTFVLDTMKDGPQSYLYRIPLAIAIILVGLQFQFWLGNYADHLPSHLHFKVNFSEGRIQRELDLIPVAELERAGILVDPDWREMRKTYLQGRNGQIQEILPGCDFRFDNDTDGLGTFSFHVVKRSGSLQTYEADKTSFGVVDFHSHYSGIQRVLMARFLLQSDGTEYFNVTRRDALFPPGLGIKGMFMPSRYMIVRPLFSQMAYVNLTTHTSIGTIVALTRVRYFPTVLLTSTIYLADTSKIIKTELTGAPITDTQSEEADTVSREPRLIPIACGIYEH